MDNEIRELENRAFHLHTQITSTQHIRTKNSLIDEKAAIDMKINDLKRLQKEIVEKESAKKLLTLITENRDFIFFSVNMQRIKIDKTGNVEFTFTPCGHKKIMPISELRLHMHQDNHAKFGIWRRLLKEGVTYTGSMSCKQCRKDKQKRFQKLRTYGNRPISRLSWELRALR